MCPPVVLYYWTNVSEDIINLNILEKFVDAVFPSASQMCKKRTQNSAKKNLIQYRFKTYTIIYCALGPNFCKKMKLGGRPHWGPQKLLFDKKVAEMSSFHHLKV